MFRQRELFIIFTVVIMAGLIGMSGCGKRVATSKTGEPMMPSTEAGTEVGTDEGTEAITEPPIPRVERVEEVALIKETEQQDIQEVVIDKTIDDVYFDFDKDLIREEARRVLGSNAGILKKDGFDVVVIEGHADERGTSDYNLALGERRAESVKRYLTILGIAPSRIKTISYGKEKPFCADHNEDCWQQNRRAHFVVEK